MRGWAVPLAEMAFWEGRHEVLGALYEQLDTPGARAAVALVRARTTDRNMLAAFHAQHGDLLRVRAPARLFWLVRVRPAAEGPVDHGPGAERRCMNIGCGIDGTEPGRGATQRYNSCVLLCAPVHAIPIMLSHHAMRPQWATACPGADRSRMASGSGAAQSDIYKNTLTQLKIRAPWGCS
jgi:hypothetical protein